MSPHRVVVVGGGFGGLQAVMKLRRAPVEIVLVDRRNFHLFQPLTYQVATGALSPGQIAYPLRAIFPRAGRVLLIEAADRLLTSFPPSLCERAARSLRKLGVTPMFGSTVVGVDRDGVDIKEAGGTRERIPARTVVWAAGVSASG